MFEVCSTILFAFEIPIGIAEAAVELRLENVMLFQWFCASFD
jgi:hypothetical protein